MVYSGDIGDGARQTILRRFNSEKNRYGDDIKVLLVTEAGAEGINILEAQHMHILESSTREMKIQQAIGRVVRYKSHMVDGYSPMPKSEQVVHIWRYWSTGGANPVEIEINIDGKNMKKIITDKTAVDEVLYKKGRIQVNTINSFLNLLKKASVTSYNKSDDKTMMMKEYIIKEGPEVLNISYKISDKRGKSLNNPMEGSSMY